MQTHPRTWLAGTGQGIMALRLSYAYARTARKPAVRELAETL